MRNMQYAVTCMQDGRALRLVLVAPLSAIFIRYSPREGERGEHNEQRNRKCVLCAIFAPEGASYPGAPGEFYTNLRHCRYDI